MNNAHKEEIQRIQDMHDATVQSLEHRIVSSKQNADKEVERLENFKAELLEKQVTENNSLQGKNSELEYKVSQSESRVRELMLSVESYKEDFKKYKKDILMLENDLDEARKQHDSLQESLRTRELEYQSTVANLKKKLNNYDGALIALSARTYSSSCQEALLSVDKATYSSGLVKLQTMVKNLWSKVLRHSKIILSEKMKKLYAS